MRVVFNGRTHADNDTPRGVRCEDKHWIINGTELRVNSGLHIMPLVHLECIVRDRSGEVCGCVTVQAIALWQLGLHVLAIWLNESTHVPQWLLDLFAHPIEHREVVMP